MPTTTRDPLTRVRRQTKVWVAAGAVLVVATGAWAFRSVASEDGHALPSPSAARAEVSRARTAFEVESFRTVDLWPGDVKPPSSEDADAAEAARNRAPDVRLIGIVHHPNEALRSAALYCTDRDRLLVLSPGETDGDLFVVRVDETEVEIAHGSWTGRLRLEDGPRRGAGP